MVGIKVMAIPTPATANLEIRMSNKGKLEAYWRGERLPCISITLDADRPNRASVELRFIGPQVMLTTQADEPATGMREDEDGPA